MKVIADSSIPWLKQFFPPPFELTQVHELTPESLKDNTILLCRSTLKVDEKLLKSSRVKLIATASSGSDHVDKSYLRQRGIAFYDAKGCNAHAVTDYIMCTLAYLLKNQFLKNKSIGIIGVGKVGAQVNRRLKALGFATYLNDPPRALVDSSFTSTPLSNLLDCDVISLHTPLTWRGKHPTANLINHEFLSRLKPGTIIINAARGNIVNEQAILTNQNILYCCDVFANEPNPNPAIIEHATLCTPHIAGHSIEAKRRATEFISKKIHRFFDFPPPCMSIQTSGNLIITPNNWLETCLRLYDPKLETQRLKQLAQAQSMPHYFSHLRQQHNTRHDFIFTMPTSSHLLE